jgi:hypothetical protein
LILVELVVNCPEELIGIDSRGTNKHQFVGWETVRKTAFDDTKLPVTLCPIRAVGLDVIRTRGFPADDDDNVEALQDPARNPYNTRELGVIS